MLRTDPLANLAAGEFMRLWWQCPEGDLPALPLLAAKGTRPGPLLVVTGGVHGDEYEGPAAIAALFAALDPKRLRGTVLALPVLNRAAWEARTRVTPGDGINLNRVFPGVPNAASSTEALAFRVFAQFVRPADALIDLHSGGAALVHLPLIGWYESESENADKPGAAEWLARHFGTAFHPWRIPDVPGVLSYEAHRIGKIALGAEWQGGARLDSAGQAAYKRGLENALRALAMLSMEEEAQEEKAEQNAPIDTRPPIVGDYQDTVGGGLFVPCVTLGDRVKRGDVIGRLYDLLGQETEAVTAAREGIVAGLPHIPFLHPGDRIAYIG